jgi:hypothetical protein
MDDALKVLFALALVILLPSGMIALFILEANLEERLRGRACSASPRATPSRTEATLSEKHTGARCPVCATAIERADLVLCRRCRTPHHADCWRYARRCSTYACGERESMAP